MADSGAEYPTTIGADASFKGQLEFEKGARILGKFDGEVKSKGELMIAEGATFSGEAEAGDIRVEGQVKGNLQASGKAFLSASARLEGDIQAARLEVTEGAVLIGRCTVGTKASATAGKPVSRPVGEVVPESPARPKGQPAAEPMAVKK